MKAINEFSDINQLAEQFILQFGIESHKDLKRVGEFQSLEDEALKRKIYDRTRYKLQKETLKLVPDILTIETKAERVQAKHLRLLDKRIKILKLALLAFIFAFLATESFKFYDQFEVLPIFKYSIPAMIEISIFLLSLKNSAISKILLTGLVVFNIATFSYKTIESDKSLKLGQSSAASKTRFLDREMAKIELQIKTEEIDLKAIKASFEGLISKKYFKAANATYSASIAEKTEDLKKLREQSMKIGAEILKIGEVRSGENFISMDTLFMISLKIILQMIFLFLILDLKKSLFKCEF
jgi:hypothetical protein